MAQTIAFPLQTVAGPKQARSERTLQRLLDAAQVLIEEKGHAAVSIPEIARRARSSVGGFYARFRDKNELLRALEERHFIEVWQRLEALADARRWENVSTAQVVEAAVAELVSVTRERRRLIAAFLVSAIQDPAIREGGLRFRRRVEECIRGLLLPRRGEMDHPDPALAVDRGRRPPAVRRRAPAGAHDDVSPLRRHRTAGIEPDEGTQTQEVAMEYAQRNPLPVPPGGAYEPIKATIDSVFDWQYALRKRNLLNLYEKGKTLAWNANDLDWSTDVDIERLVRQRVANGLAPMINSMLSPPVHLGDDEVIRMQLHLNAFMLSQFLHGEEGALLATAKIVQGVPWAEAKFYAANQVADEARHVEVYHR